jgi:Zn-dependent protease
MLFVNTEEVPPEMEPPVVKKWSFGKLIGIMAAIGVFFLKSGKFLLVGVQAIKLVKITALLKTGGTMLLSVWFYQLHFGLPFSIGVVLSILLHELGHVVAAIAVGVPVTAPLFLPGFGAMISHKEAPKTAFAEAVIGIGGPLGGLVATVAFLLLAISTGESLFLALTYTSALINLFNLTPVMPLDGGWITGAVSPYLWLIGICGLGYSMFAYGFINPLLLLIMLLSLPRLIHGLRHGTVASSNLAPATTGQKFIMGTAYIATCGVFGFLMVLTHR